MTISIFQKMPVPTYARAGEDVIAAQYFPMPYQGFYVDAGCYKACDYSNTYLLYQMGWRGLCIDANPAYAAEYAEKRPNDIFVNSGLGEQAGTLTFYDVAEDASSSTFHAPRAAYLQEQGFTVSERLVGVQRIMDVINAHNIQAIDLLSVDVEFFDEAIIRSFDFNEFRPRVVLVEDLTFSMHRPQDSSIFQYLTQQGYMLDARCLNTCLYIIPITGAEKLQYQKASGA